MVRQTGIAPDPPAPRWVEEKKWSCGTRADARVPHSVNRLPTKRRPKTPLAVTTAHAGFPQGFTNISLRHSTGLSKSGFGIEHPTPLAGVIDP